MKHIRSIAALLLVGGMLAACGGGGGVASDPAPAANEVPASALSSPAAYTQFTASLTQSDTAQPIGMGNVIQPPTSETDSPLPI